MIRLLSIFTLSLTIPALASAQGNGAISTVESEASLTYTVNVIDPQTKIQISGLEDLNFDYNVGADSLPDQSIDICVYISGDTANTYTLKLEADKLTDGGLQYPYTFKYEDTLAQNPVSLSGTVSNTGFDQTLAGFTASKSPNCADGGTPARLTVGLQTDPTIATPGATAEMRFTVSPN